MNGWLIVLAIVGGLFLLLLLALFLGKASARVTVEGEVTLTVSVFGIRKRILPRRSAEKPLRDVAACRDPEKALRREEKRLRKKAEKAERKRLKKEKEREKKAAGTKRPAPSPNLKENLDMIFALLRRAYELTGGKIGIEFRKLRLRVATGDAASTAILYGVVLQSSAYLLQWVESHYNHIRRRDGDMTVEVDYLGRHPSAEVNLRLSVRLFRAVGIGLGMFRAFLAERKRARKRAARRVAAAKRTPLPR